MDVGRVTGAAKRRRERRLRSMLRHKRQTVAMELAAALHHSRDVGPGTHVGLRAQKTASSGGRRPGVLKEPEPPYVVDRVLRRTVDQIVDALPGLPALDVPVPQMVENVTDTLLRILDVPIADQVIEVPKISCSPCPSRSRVPEPQFAEQLVEVPTVLTHAHRFADRGADRRHSSSPWFRRQTASSRSSPRTEFNSDGFFSGTHF